MSDESFFREVNQEIRHDRTRAVWSRFGKWLMAAAVAAVLAAAAYVAWQTYEEAQANASGDRYLAALDLASAGDFEPAVKELEGLAAEGYGAYPNLARMRIGAVRQAQGDKAGAVAAFDAVSADGGAPQPIRDIAAIRAAYVVVDTGLIDDVRARVERLTGDAEPLRFPAREVLGLASWKAGDPEGARAFFEGLRDDGAAPAGIGIRARLMLEMIAAGNVFAAPALAAPAVVDAPVTPPPAAVVAPTATQAVPPATAPGAPVAPAPAPAAAPPPP